MYLVDQQAALGFLQSQTAHIESQVVEVQYPDIQYPDIIPVDSTANEWATSVEYYSTDRVGKAGWFHHHAKDIHVADVQRNRHEVSIEMADVGYRYTLQELGTAMMIPGRNLSADRAAAARRAYEEFIDEVALRGDAEKNFHGLINYPGISSALVPAGAGSGTPLNWIGKTPDEILADVNAVLIGMWTSSNTVEMADTILIPPAAMAAIATRRLTDTQITVLQFLLQNNVYSHTTGRPLVIRAVRGLETAGVGGTGRMIAYRRDPLVLKLHIPMTHRFLQPFQTAPLVFDVPGIFRLAGLEVRRPGAIRYADGILAAPSDSE